LRDLSDRERRLEALQRARKLRRKSDRTDGVAA